MNSGLRDESVEPWLVQNILLHSYLIIAAQGKNTRSVADPDEEKYYTSHLVLPPCTSGGDSESLQLEGAAACYIESL